MSSIQMINKMKIDIFTLSRSDYAAFRPIIRELKENKKISLGIIVGGSHLLEEYGYSIDEVKSEFFVDDTVDFIKGYVNDKSDIAEGHSNATIKFIDVLKKRTPDAIFLLGDRWELLSISIAASLLGIPIIHHSGGDITLGAFDNKVRNIVSDLSSFHFVALEEHKERLIQRNIDEDRICVTGEPSLLNLSAMTDQAQKRSLIQIKHLPEDVITIINNIDQTFALATIHPTTYDKISYEEQANIFIAALGYIDMPIIITCPNPDEQSGLFHEQCRALSSSQNRIHFVSHLGAILYQKILMQARIMVGNSSSGLLEAPSFSLPVVNIGRRQEGRIRARNVIDVDFELHAIVQGIQKGLSKSFRDKLDDFNPYYNPLCAKIISDKITNIF